MNLYSYGCTVVPSLYVVNEMCDVKSSVIFQTDSKIFQTLLSHVRLSVCNNNKTRTFTFGGNRSYSCSVLIMSDGESTARNYAPILTKFHRKIVLVLKIIPVDFGGISQDLDIAATNRNRPIFGLCVSKLGKKPFFITRTICSNYDKKKPVQIYI